MPLVRQFTGAVARLNHQLPIWLLAAMVLVAVWWHTFNLIDQDYARVKVGAENEIANLARVSQEHAERTFYSADQTLLHVLGEYQRHDGTINLKEVSEEGLYDSRILLQIAMIGANGLLQQSSLPFSDHIDLSDQEYFKVHRAPINDTLFISPVVLDRASGKWSIQLSRRISGKNGKFDGVVVASLDPTYFTRFYAELKLGDQGVAALYDLSGSLLARKAGRKESFAGNAASEPIFSRVLHGEQLGSQTYHSAIDGIERLYHFKKLPSYALLVLIGETTQDVFAEQQKTRLQRLREAAVLSVLLLALTLLLSWSGTVRKRHLEAQRQALMQLQDLTDHVPGLVYEYLLRPDGSSCFPFASEGLRELCRLSPQQVSADAAAFFALTHPDDVAGVNASIQLSAQTLTPWAHEYRVTFADDRVRWFSGKALPQRRPDGSVLWHGFMVDVTARKATEAEIEHLAFYDPLTGLPNRRLLVDRLTQSLAVRARSEHKGNGALLFIDIDNFKNLNDTQGHEQGDLMLQQVAIRLNFCVREGDTVARLGGDDFVVMLLDLSDNATEAATQAEAVGQKVLDTLRQPYQFGRLAYHGSASVGVALFQARHDSVEELFKRADLALYRAKDAGRNTLRFFDPEMQAAMNARAELEAELRLGLRLNQFRLYYQPQVDQQRRLMGVEALVRWQHPQRGLVSPANFIALAEETGLILPLGQWVLETACCQLKEWTTQPERAHLTIAVNVSAVQFHHVNFVSEVLATLERTGAPPTRLKLELTESLLVKDIEDIIAKMVALKSHGVGFSLDDFGTGYSSLSYLKRLPLDQIKIDQSFVGDAVTNFKDAALVKATVAMGHGLGMMVIAEGVETQQQCDFLESEGCHNYQGYLFGRPAPVQDLERFFPGMSQAVSPVPMRFDQGASRSRIQIARPVAAASLPGFNV